MSGADAVRSLPEGPGLEERYFAAIASFVEFKELTGCNNQWLADQVGVSCSSITNFLNRKPGYEPRRTRSKMMGILAIIEGLEGRPDVIVERNVDSRLEELLGDDADTEARRFSLLHAKRARAQRGTNPLLRSDIDTQVLYLEAIHAPPSVRPFMCNNLLLTFTTMVDKPESRRLRPPALRATSLMARRLDDEAQATTAAAISTFLPGNARSYAGYVLARAGLLLGDRELTTAGFGRLYDGIALPHTSSSGVWPNALKTVDHALGLGDACAPAEAERLALVTRQHRGEEFDRAWSHGDLPHLTTHWSHTAPELLPRDPSALQKGVER